MLECDCPLRLLQTPNSPQQRPLLSRINFVELLGYFRTVQDRHRESRRKPRSLPASMRGIDSSGLKVSSAAGSGGTAGVYRVDDCQSRVGFLNGVGDSPVAGGSD